MYLGIGAAWIASLLWFHPRLASLLSLADSPFSWLALAFFIVFIEIAWLYAFYNIGVFVTAAVYRIRHRAPSLPPMPTPAPAVALLYTTYNDFVERSVRSCIRQEYPDYHVYILDDSTDPDARKQVDGFATRYPDLVTVVRRPDRKGFKAGNLNHALTHVCKEPLFALVDADEILPPDFLTRVVPRIWSDPMCGFVQANHRANPADEGELPKALGVGVGIHWRWYQPLRNRYGFVMLLGHGAVVRRKAWRDVRGFPALVSEDLAFAMRLREHGWRGYFAEDVICQEDFPPTVRAFRVRHMKWTRGTSEFLTREFWRLLKAKRITWTEKLDILFPTMGLPLSLFWFLYLIDANLVLGWLYGTSRPITFAIGSAEIALPGRGLDAGFNAIYSTDFLLITLATFAAPVLTFFVDLAMHPRQLIKFLGKSTTLYASLGPLSFLGVLSYAVTGRATFLVTGDTSSPRPAAGGGGWRALFGRIHPDQPLVQGFEILTGLTFAAVAVMFFQPATLGLAIGFLLLPIMHRIGWEHPISRSLVYLPLMLIGAGIALGVMSLFQLQTVFFGYGFHF
jgi:cellulose synthase/poly-beta-1,6-N-acetylglucosamine synthase-like glycosyltransferase